MGAAGVGALLGALTLALQSGVAELGRWIALSCAGFGFFLLMFSFSQHFWLSTVLLFPVGFCMVFEMSSSNTLIQAMAPDELRGRVMAIYSMMYMGMAPFGALMGGALAEKLGAPLAIALGGVGSIMGAVIFSVKLPNLGVEAHQLILAQEVAGGESPPTIRR
jgi:MFS family permease